jgi:elongation factor Ts
MAANMGDIKKLRETTGAGMMDCKKVLEEAEGDFDKAVELLRKKGAATAAKRAEREANEGVVVSYVHNFRIGALLELDCETDFVARNEDFKNLAQELAMQVAAAAPEYITPDEVPDNIVEKEKEIEKEALKDSGKPADVIDKIIDGKINKFYSQICLMKQPYIKDPSISVEDLINGKTAAIGEKITVKQFARFEIGK